MSPYQGRSTDLLTSLLLASFCTILTSAHSVPSLNWRRASCMQEIENANRTVASWSVAMRKMIAESLTPAAVATNENTIAQEESNRIQELIERFSATMNRRPIERLVKDLVSIRRRSNGLALEIYRKTYDMRWPQTYVQLSVAVERVHQACLSNVDRAAMLVLNSPLGAAVRFPSPSSSSRG